MFKLNLSNLQPKAPDSPSDNSRTNDDDASRNSSTIHSDNDEDRSEYSEDEDEHFETLPATLSEEPKEVPKLNLGLLAFKEVKQPATPTSTNSSSRSHRSSSGRNESSKRPASPQSPPIPPAKLGLNLSKLNTTAAVSTNNAPITEHQQQVPLLVPQIIAPKTKTIKVDYLISDMCTCQVPEDADNQAVYKQVYEQVCKSCFGSEYKPNPSKKSLELFKIQPFDTSSQQTIGSEQQDNSVMTIVCKQTETDFTAKMLKQLLYENKMLKIKLEKSAQAIATYEKENQRLKKELAKQKQTTAIASDKEVEMLRMKLVKHEQLRADVVKTVDSLKKQHALLTQAILSQQNLHEALSQNVSQSTD